MHGIAHSRCDSLEHRPDDQGITPWEQAAVQAFLRDSLHLSDTHPGRVVTSHHEVFYAWRDGIDRGLLKPPFFVCHVDAHSDLGMGTPSWVYLHSDFLELELKQRRFPMEGDWGLNFASFMPYAIGNRWISRIDFITSESWQDDIPRALLSDGFPPIDAEFFRPPVHLEIELMHAPRILIERNHYLTDFTKIRKRIGEPVIPFDLLNCQSIEDRYSTTEWDFVFLSHSPGYVPHSADALLPVISSHINTF